MACTETPEVCEAFWESGGRTRKIGKGGREEMRLIEGVSVFVLGRLAECT